MRKLIVLAVLALGPTAAQAEKGPFYLGAGVTNSSLRFDISDPIELQNRAWKAFAGVRPLDLLAVEADYIDFGSGSRGDAYHTTHDDSSAWAGYAVGLIPVLPAMDFYVKLGAARWKIKNVDIAQIGPGLGLVNVTKSYSATNLAAGIGVQAHVKTFGVRLEYEGVAVYGDEATVAPLSAFLNF